jgi:hypothetical protein
VVTLHFRIQSVFLLSIKYTHDYPQQCFSITSNADEVFIAEKKNCSDEAMKRLMPHRLASLLHCCQHYAEFARKQGKTLQHICKGKDNDVFRLCYGNYRNNVCFLEIVNGIHYIIASVR